MYLTAIRETSSVIIPWSLVEMKYIAFQIALYQNLIGKTNITFKYNKKNGSINEVEVLRCTVIFVLHIHYFEYAVITPRLNTLDIFWDFRIWSIYHSHVIPLLCAISCHVRLCYLGNRLGWFYDRCAVVTLNVAWFVLVNHGTITNKV